MVKQFVTPSAFLSLVCLYYRLCIHILSVLETPCTSDRNLLIQYSFIIKILSLLIFGERELHVFDQEISSLQWDTKFIPWESLKGKIGKCVLYSICYTLFLSQQYN